MALLGGIWDLARLGIEPVYPALAGGIFTTELPGKLNKGIFNPQIKQLCSALQILRVLLVSLSRVTHIDKILNLSLDCYPLPLIYLYRQLVT